MRTLTITCDRCKGPIEDQGGTSYNVSIIITEPGRTLDWTNLERRVTEEWCRACVVSGLGLTPKWKRESDPPEPDPRPTIDQMIREIVREWRNE